MKCTFCKKYDFNKENCSQCEFEFDEDLYWNNDDKWDIFKIDDDYEWGHLQIQYRLKSKGIECLYADVWFDNNMAYILGAKANAYKVAQALKIKEECIYDDFEHGFMIINLFQEKYIRGLLDDL